ncbi:unnamed protein product [Heterobilharzia americana]|nr:unnamed protein product [Heterobilharzia americana]
MTKFLSSVSMPARLRHPSILQVHKSWSNSIDTWCLVVENSVPFNTFSENPMADELLSGSRSLLSALSFLHNTVVCCFV